MIALLFVASMFAAETASITGDVQSLRFPDDDTVQGPFLSEGDEVQVLVEEGNRVRVRKQDAYGWVAASVVSRQPTEPPADLE